jgi:hypothetical protein
LKERFMRSTKLAATAGIAYVLLAFVEFVGPSFPSTSDSARTLGDYFVQHRTWTLAAVVIEGAGNAIWVVFLCGLVLLVIRAGSPTAGLTALTGGALNVAVSLSGLAAIAALGFSIAGAGDPSLSKAFFDFAAMTLVLSNFMLALTAAAVAAAPFARWFRMLSALAALVFLAGGAALARHGSFSPDGAVQFATYGLELLWTIAAAAVLFRSSELDDVSARRDSILARVE